MPASKIERLQDQIEAARRRRSAEIAKLQEELAVEMAKARKKKGKASADPESSPDNS